MSEPEIETTRGSARPSPTARLPGSDPDWWRRGFIYQIYPASFADANGDGYGDLAGIASRLDYVESLGASAIWLSPIYPSPMADWGYDVADYCDVHPIFGTLADFDQLVDQAHARRLRVILDLVPNHTSDQHPWFEESRSSRSNPRRDWYIWRDPAPDGGPPNNWVSYFGSAWTLDAPTGQYYFHQFRPQQPELNYRNPAVLPAILDVMRFWLDRGVDGFRVDVIALLAKDDRFLDEPPNPAFRPGMPLWHQLLHVYTEDQPAVHDYIRAMRGVLDEYGDRVMLGELDPIPGLMGFYGANLDECQLPFNFNLLEINWTAERVREVVDRYDAAIPPGAWPNWVVGNHDRPRIADRIGPERAALAQMLLLTLRGTPICYYGDELGKAGTAIPIERLRDFGEVLPPDQVVVMSRDPERTPMQWDATPNAGFCPPDVVPWLPVAADATSVNVVAEDRDPRSMLTLFRRLVALRREHPALTEGACRSIDVPQPGVFAYERGSGASRLTVAVNLTGEPRAALTAGGGALADVLVSTRLDRSGPEPASTLRLRPYEGVVLRPTAGT